MRIDPMANYLQQQLLMQRYAVVQGGEGRLRLVDFYNS
jgi:hypothetical protein